MFHLKIEGNWKEKKKEREKISHRSHCRGWNDFSEPWETLVKAKKEEVIEIIECRKLGVIDNGGEKYERKLGMEIKY